MRKRSTIRSFHAILAIAAHETGHGPVALRAMDEAEARGADMAVLRPLLRDAG